MLLELQRRAVTHSATHQDDLRRASGQRMMLYIGAVEGPDALTSQHSVHDTPLG
jgi:hypothetical protein